MVFGVVTSNGDIMPPFIFLHGFKLNMEIYIKFLEEVVLLWIKWVVAARPIIWQQDYTMPHKQVDPVLIVKNFLWPHHS